MNSVSRFGAPMLALSAALGGAACYVEPLPPPAYAAPAPAPAKAAESANTGAPKRNTLFMGALSWRGKRYLR